MENHTGSLNDEFLETLLSDQGKAMTTNAKQMRWHPLVIKWYLRLCIKSHSLYEDLRNSGGLKLSTGRTLSDYKNFNNTGSGWQIENINNMRKQFEKMKPPKHGTLGLLVFDEVKINEGLVFDHKNWELVGFTDLLDDEFHGKNGKASTIKPTNKLATHVLQFFFRSLFLKFDYQCAFFLTGNLTSLQLNRMFWLGAACSTCSSLTSSSLALMEHLVTDRLSKSMSRMAKVTVKTFFPECHSFSYLTLRILSRSYEITYTAVG